MTTQTSNHSFRRPPSARLTLGCWAFVAALGLLAGCNEEDPNPDIGDATETSDGEPMTDTGEDDDESDADLPSFGDEIDTVPEICVPLGDPCSPDADSCCAGICQVNEVSGWTCAFLPA